MALLTVSSLFKDFNQPRGAILGLLSAILPLGCICATPFISIVGDRFGRRVGICTGATIMLIGGIIQGAAINRKCTPCYMTATQAGKFNDMY